MTELRDLLAQTAGLVADFRETAAQRPVVPNADLDPVRAALGDLPSVSTPADVVVSELASAIDPLLVSSAGPQTRWRWPRRGTTYWPESGTTSSRTA